MHIGEHLKNLREDRKYSINQLSLYSDVSSAHISRIERGLREPSPDILKKLAPALKTSYTELLLIAGYINNKEDFRELYSLQTPSNEHTTLGHRLRSIREEKKLTQFELSKLLNIEESSISQYEKDINTPDADKFKQLAKFFDVSIDYLLCRTDERNGYVQSDLHEDNIFYKSFEEILEAIKKGLYENGIIKNKDNIPPDIMEKIIQNTILAVSEIIKSRQDNNND